MKTVRRVLALVFLMALMLSLGTTAFAEVDPNNYTVRIFAGNMGTIDGGDVRTQKVPITAPGTALNYKNDDVTVKDDRSYVRGIRYAGQDNATVFTGNPPGGIVEDMDFVVAYGIKSSAVRYTVNYVSTGGATLAPSETYYGNIGDKPVVAFVYVEGYQPQAYNLTKTLVEDEGSNVFTFTYSQVTTTVVPQVIPGGVAPVQPAQNQQPAGQQQPAAEQPEAQAPAEPETIIDLDVPLAEPEAQPTEPGTAATQPTEPEKPTEAKTAAWIPYVLGLGGLALLLASLAALSRRRKAANGDLTVEDYEAALDEAKKEVEDQKKK